MWREELSQPLSNREYLWWTLDASNGGGYRGKVDQPTMEATWKLLSTI